MISHYENDPSDGSKSRLGHSDFVSSNGFSIDGNVILMLGRTAITHGARDVLTDYDINNALIRHKTGDWGNVTERDRNSNDNAVKLGERAISSYVSTDGVKFWIITEQDRSSTAILLPDEY